MLSACDEYSRDTKSQIYNALECKVQGITDFNQLNYVRHKML